MKKMTLVAGLLLATQLMYSQQSIPATGGDATGSGGSSSYTVVMLKISDTALYNLSYHLVDINGKAISDGSLTNGDTQINMQQLAVGMYILKVSQNNQELKTFKIIKK